ARPTAWPWPGRCYRTTRQITTAAAALLATTYDDLGGLAAQAAAFLRSCGRALGRRLGRALGRRLGMTAPRTTPFPRVGRRATESRAGARRTTNEAEARFRWRALVSAARAEEAPDDCEGPAALLLNTSEALGQPDARLWACACLRGLPLLEGGVG